MQGPRGLLWPPSPSAWLRGPAVRPRHTWGGGLICAASRLHNPPPPMHAAHAQAVTFLRRIKELVECPERMLLGV